MTRKRGRRKNLDPILGSVLTGAGYDLGARAITALSGKRKQKKKKKPRKRNALFGPFVRAMKSAERDTMDALYRSGGKKKSKARRSAGHPASSSGMVAEVASALKNLGYGSRSRSIAQAAASKAGAGAGFDDVFRAAMKRNPGVGDKFLFHGAFNEKKDAVAKERTTPGSFIKGIITKYGYRYAVLTRKPNPGIVDAIRPGDRVTIVDRFGKRHTGRAVMRSSHGGWVLNMGGPHGTPGIADERNIVKVSPRKNPRPGDYTGPMKAQTRKDIARFVKQKPKGQRRQILKELEGYVRPRALVNPKRKYSMGESVKFRAYDGKTYDAVISRVGPRGYAIEYPVRLGDGTTRIVTAPIVGGKRMRRISSNPSIAAAKAAQLYKDFHGRESSGVDEYLETVRERGELAELGRLMELWLSDDSRFSKNRPENKAADGDLLIEFPTAAPKVAADPDGDQIFLVGGDQNLDGQLRALGVESKKDIYDLGPVKAIVYHTRKKFDNFEEVDYFHYFGEESKDVADRPHLLYDRLNRRMLFAGGAYKAKPEGIVN